MPYNVPDITEILRSLTKRVSNLEAASYVYGDPDNTNNDSLVITGLAATVAYSAMPLTGAGTATINWSWSGISTDPEDLTADPVADYMFSATDLNADHVAPFSSVGTNTSTTTSAALDSTIVGRVYAVTKNGLVGPVAQLAVVTGHDTTPPPQPSTPIVTPALRGVTAFWDGLTVSVTNMPLDFDYVEVHASTAGAAFTPDDTTLVGRLFTGGGTTYVPADDNSYSTIYVRLVAYDTSGNASVPSTAGSAVPVKLTPVDLDVVLPGDIAYRDEGNLIPDGSFESAAMRAQRLANYSTTGVSYGNTAGFAAAGSWYLRFTGSATTPKYLYLTGFQGIDEAPVVGGTYLYVRAKIRGVSANGTINVVLRWKDNAGGLTYTTVLTTATSTGAYVLFEGSALVPSTAATVAVRVETVSQTAGDWYIDAVELRHVMGTVLIQDAAITRAKIANLAVGDAQIETLSAGKITTGILAANVTVSGRIATSLTGARVEMNSSGFQAFNAAGAQTVDIDTDGNAAIVGTYQSNLTTEPRVQIQAGWIFDPYVAGGNPNIYFLNGTESPGVLDPAAVYGVDGLTEAGLTPTWLFATSGSAPTIADGASSQFKLGTDQAFLLYQDNSTPTTFNGGSITVDVNGITLAGKLGVKTGGGSFHGTNYGEWYRSTTASISSGVWTAVGFDQVGAAGVVQDNGVLHPDAVTFVSTVAGWYVLTASITWAVGTAGYRAIRIKTSGGSVIARTSYDASSTPFRDLTITAAFYLPGGGYSVTVEAYQNSGSALNVQANVIDAPVFARFAQVA